MNTKESCICQLHTLVALCNKAADKAAAENWQAVTDILQGKVTPLVQQVSHEAWLKYHKSGTGAA